MGRAEGAQRNTDGQRSDSHGTGQVAQVARWLATLKTSGDEFHGARGAIVIPDMKRKRNPVAAVAAGLDCETQHPGNVPYAELGIRDVIPSS